MTDANQFGTLDHAQATHHLGGTHYVQSYGAVPGMYPGAEVLSSGPTRAADNPFAFPVQHPPQSEFAVSPTSSYAPSISDRRASLSYGQTQSFNPPPSVVQDRRLSSPGLMGMNQPMVPPSRYQQPTVQQQRDSQAFFNSKFQFGNSTQDGAQQQQQPHQHQHQHQRQQQQQQQSYREGYTTPAYAVNALNPNEGERRGSFVENRQGCPPNYHNDRRYSHPVISSNSFDAMHAIVRQRQASAVDWHSYTTQNNNLRQAGSESFSGYQGPDGVWNTLDSAQGMVAMSHQSSFGEFLVRNPLAFPLLTCLVSTDQYGQNIAMRRQSVPYPPGNTFVDQDQSSVEGSGLFQSTNMPLSGSDEESVVMQPPLPFDGNPDQASMMNTFSAKDTNSGHKKHVCNVCKKRFTRPSSLTTHMFSHTGEKPFVCDFEDCRRQFSVISNLRRHKKIHTQAYQDGMFVDATQPTI